MRQKFQKPPWPEFTPYNQKSAIPALERNPEVFEKRSRLIASYALPAILLEFCHKTPGSN